MREELQVPAGYEGMVWHYCFAGRLHPMHRHVELELNLVVRGSASYLIGERRYHLASGSLIWLFPEQDHILLEQSPDFTMWIVVFRPCLLARVCVEEADAPLREANPRGYLPRRLSQSAARRIETLLDEIRLAARATSRFNAGLAYSLLLAWSEYQRAGAGVAGAGLHPAVERAASLLRHAEAPPNIPELARISGLSTSRLSRLFHEQIGLTLVDFRNRQRVERFLQAYGNGQRVSMLEAALDAGFGSYPQFHRVFKQWMGCSPRAYLHSGGE